MHKTARALLQLAVVISFILEVGCKDNNHSQSAPVASKSHGIAPPPFQLFKQVAGMEPVSFVVKETATDEELQNLLLYFRDKVQAGDFHSLGIDLPTTKHFEALGYQDGSLYIFRGARCATEAFHSTEPPGPCGYGEHFAAVYQWGLPAIIGYKEVGEIIRSNGQTKRVFQYQ